MQYSFRTVMMIIFNISYPLPLRLPRLPGVVVVPLPGLDVRLNPGLSPVGDPRGRTLERVRAVVIDAVEVVPRPDGLPRSLPHHRRPPGRHRRPPGDRPPRRQRGVKLVHLSNERRRLTLQILLNRRCGGADGVQESPVGRRPRRLVQRDRGARPRRLRPLRPQWNPAPVPRPAALPELLVRLDPGPPAGGARGEALPGRGGGLHGLLKRARRRADVVEGRRLDVGGEVEGQGEVVAGERRWSGGEDRGGAEGGRAAGVE